MRLGVLATHPIQYHAPLYRELARRLDLHVYFAHRQTAAGQAAAGFGVAFEWDVDLLSGYPHTFLTNVADRPSPDTFGGCNTPEIRDAIARERFDAFLVTGWNTRSFWQAITSSWRTGTPLLVRGDSHLQTPRSWSRRMAKEVAYRAFIPRFSAYLVVGQRNRDYYVHYGADPDRFFDAPHFVDIDRFGDMSSQHDRSDLRVRHGIRPDSRVVLFAGKFTDVKRPLDFVHAVAQLADRDANVEGVMVGDGPLRPAVEDAIERTDAPIHLLGFRNQSEMPAAYALADVLALPSEHETWGLVVNEAQACGLPVVATDGVGCAPDLLVGEPSGRTYPVGDVDALADALARLTRHARTEPLQRALREIVDRHSIAKAVDGTLAAVRFVSGQAVQPTHG